MGNRLSQTVCVSAGNCATTTYTYDAANRLTSVNGVSYTWDANGNLLNDGTSTYAYDAANRLKSVTGGATTSLYSYNGLGDRVSQTVNSLTTTYVLDLNAGLTQVLSDGTNTYLYGAGRIGELQPAGFAYHLGDALGSVRQLADASGSVRLARSYEAYGSMLTSAGIGTTSYNFTGEWADATGLIHLRARYYAPGQGRFLMRDIWNGDFKEPHTFNKWNYVGSNPVNRVDPSGLYWWGAGQANWDAAEVRLQNENIHIRIQAIMMIRRMDQVHAEYRIPVSLRPVDLLDSITGEMWEIKPWADRAEAWPELAIRLAEMDEARRLRLLTGMTPVATKYNWNFAPIEWIPGFNFPTKDLYIGTDETGMYDFYATQIEHGVIVWWKYDRPKPRQSVPHPIMMPENMKRGERNARPRWVPAGTVPMSAINANVVTTCVVGIVVIGTALIVLNPVPGDEAILPALWAAGAAAAR